MQLRKLAIAFLVLILLAKCFALLDSDNDLVPDEQELKDGTNPDDPNDNALALTISGDVAVGKTIVLSVEHETLGKIPDVDFVIKTKAKTINLNSGSSGEVSFKIEDAGVHYITAQKKNFSITRYICPACGYEENETELVPFVVLLTGHFTNVVIALMFFILFATLLRGYLIKSDNFAHIVSGAAAFAIFFANYYFLFPLLPIDRLVVQLSLLGELLGTLSGLALLRAKKVTKRIIRTEASERRAEKKAISITPRLNKIIVPLTRIFALQKHKAKELKKMSDLKQEITQTREKLGSAISDAQKLENHRKVQEKMHAISKHIEKLHEGLYKAKVMKEDVAQKAEKSIEDMRAERELELMIEDLSELLAKELQISELPETAPSVQENKSFVEKLKAKFIAKPKEAEAKANVCISISDSYGRALNASMASFFIGSKEIKPIKVVAEKAYFYFSQTVVEMYVRYLGFVDSYRMIEPGQALEEIEIKMNPDLLINVVDSSGAPLRDAFITIVNEKDEKVEDIYKNTIWKTPFPNNAEDGTAAIPINPAGIKGSILKIKVVRAGFENKEVVVPASKISTEEQLVKIIALEKIAATQS